MSIGLRVKELREEKKMRQIDLANELGVAQNLISRLESGKGITLDEIMIAKMCAILNTTYDYLFEGKGSKYLLTQEEINAAIVDAKDLKSTMTEEEVIQHLAKLNKRKDEILNNIKELLN